MEDIKTNILNFINMLIDVIIAFLKAFFNFNFLVFFSVGIIGIGGLGYWIDFKLGNDLKMDIFTFSMAIIGTQILNAITAKKINSAIASLGALIGFIAMLYLFNGLYDKDLEYLEKGCLLTLVLYFFIESNDEKYKQKRNTNPTGKENASVDELQDS